MRGYRLRKLSAAELLVLCIVWRGHSDPWSTWLALLNQLIKLDYVEAYEWEGDADWTVWEIIYEVEKVVDVEEFPDSDEDVVHRKEADGVGQRHTGSSAG